MLPLDAIKEALKPKAITYCETLTFPEPFDWTDFSNKRRNHVAAYRAAKEFIPKNEEQLKEFLQKNPSLRDLVRDLVEAKQLLEKLSLDIYRFEHGERNIETQQRQEKIDAYAEIVRHPSPPLSDTDQCTGVTSKEIPTAGQETESPTP